MPNLWYYNTSISEISSDSSDISDTPVKANQNKVASFTSDISDISDSTSSNMKMMADVTTDEQNHRASDTSDLSDIYDAKAWILTQNKSRAVSLGLDDLIHGHVKIVNKRGMYTI